MLCSVMARLVGSVSGRIPITQNSCLQSRRLLTSRPSTNFNNNGVAPKATYILRRFSSSSISTFKAKAMQSKEHGRRFPPQHQDGQPGKEYLMDPLPIFKNPNHKPTDKLKGKVALVVGGDSGIGRAVCHLFAREGATIAFTYVKDVEDIDANNTLKMIHESKTKEAGNPIAIPTDVRYDQKCKDVVDEVVAKYGGIDVLVNNAAVQYETYTLDDITEERLDRIYKTNIYSHFFMTRHAVKYMKPGSSIVNSTSALGFTGSAQLLDYASTKGAIVNYTKSLALFLVNKGIRVNGVAPGPIWTPLEASSLNDEEIAIFGSQVPMNRAAQPVEVAPSYLFLASEDSSYYTGTFLHPDGGETDDALPLFKNNNNTKKP